MRILFILIFFLLSGCAKQGGSFISEFGNKRPIVAAHRAEHSNHSENSIEAVVSAQNEDISLIEIDIRESQDGELYLFHNRKIDPETIRAPQTLIGQSFSSLTSDQIGTIVLPHGEKIPTLTQILTSMPSRQSSLLLDIKGDAPLRSKVIDAIEKQSARNKFWFLCYDPGCISQVKAKRIEGVDIIARVNKELTLSQAYTFSPKIIQISCEQSCKTQVEQIKSLDSSILVLATTLSDTLDTKNNWQRVLADGVDIILTDKPFELRLLHGN